MSIKSQRFYKMFVSLFFLFVTVAITGCSSSGGSTSDKDESKNGKCEKPKSYNKQNLDKFLSGSYGICVNLMTANEILQKTNTILQYPEGPMGWAEAEFNKETNKVQNNPLELLNFRISESIPSIDKLLTDLADAVNQSPTLIASTPGALSEAQSLGMFDMPGAVSSVNEAKSNLTKIGEELPKVINGLKQVHVGLLNIVSKIQKGEPLNMPLLTDTTIALNNSSTDSTNESKQNSVVLRPVDLSKVEGLESQLLKEIDSLKTEKISLQQKIDSIEKNKKILMMKLSDLEAAKEVAQMQPQKADTVLDQATAPQIAQYEDLIAHAKKRDFNACIAGIQSLLNTGIGADYKGNCYYWMGLCRYSMGDSKSAIVQFKKVIQLPVSRKKDAAYLMLGKSYRKSGNLEASRVEFKTLIDQYPRSRYVREAKLLLEKK